MQTRLTQLLHTRYPIIQAGMVWVSGHRLASAVSEAGALGVIGAGSMKPELLREHIHKTRTETKNPFGVNIPLLRGDAAELVRVVVDERVPVVITSAGHPGKFAEQIRASGGALFHVVANVKQARKAAEVGCDAVVAEGFEAGGHDGIDEITTLALVPQVVDAVRIPVAAAGGIADGRQMCAALALGAAGVQVGTRFAATVESSAHDRYKQAIVEAGDSSTVLTVKKIAPVRLIRNPFAEKAVEAELRGASKEEMTEMLGSKRERAGIFEGNWEEGEFEAGQGSGLVHSVISAGDVVRAFVEEYEEARKALPA